MERVDQQLQESYQRAEDAEYDRAVFFFEQHEQGPEVRVLVPALDALQEGLLGVEVVLVPRPVPGFEIHNYKIYNQELSFESDHFFIILFFDASVQNSILTDTMFRCAALQS